MWFLGFKLLVAAFSPPRSVNRRMAGSFELLIGVVMLYASLSTGVTAADPPPGAIVSECRDRYFWVSVDSGFAGLDYDFNVVDGQVVQVLDETYAAQCGFTHSSFNLTGRLIFRASFFACHVVNVNDQTFTLSYQFVTRDESGRATVFPSAITCRLLLPWKPREVVCEENYMEVSVGRDVPVIQQEGPLASNVTMLNFQGPGEAMATWQIAFQKSGVPDQIMNVTYAISLGYMVNSTSSRAVFRSAYNKSKTEILKVDGVTVEAIDATIFFQQKWMLILIDVSAACTKDPGTFDGTYLIWSTPRIMLPLVQDPSSFEDKSIGMGLGGQLLNSSTMNQRGYKLQLVKQLMQISIPYGAVGGYLESRVIDNHYNQRYSIDLFFEHLWADDQYEVTQHCMFVPVSTPFIPQTPFTIDQTIPEEKMFTVYLGIFNPDVELKALNLNGVPLTMPQVQARGFPVSEVQYPNGTHAYVLKVPFQDPIVIKDYISKGVNRYTLKINYTLNIIPKDDPYYHPATVTQDIKDILPPEVTGVCKNQSILFTVQKEEVNNIWLLYIGEDQLTTELAAERGYILQNGSMTLVLEVPLFAVGFSYEEVSLTDFYASITINVKDYKTLEVVNSTRIRCLFSTTELLVCMPNGFMTAVVSTTVPVPYVDPKKTTLLDKKCGPKEADDTRALFNFSVSTCGTRRYVTGQYLIYENEVVYTRVLYPYNAPVITRDTEYRLTIRCYYPINGTRDVFVDREFVPKTRGYGSLIASDTLTRVKRPRAAFGSQSRIVRGAAWSGDVQQDALTGAEPEVNYVPVLGVTIAVFGVLLLVSMFFIAMKH
ncbi:uncharacterized protein [Lepisosteus oculatus]|uniref:uncharacterized protein isoform X2 n=1 Tax=Lepisosteus oculatus TaxID=7918 RepID=UPI003721EE39